MEGVLDPVQEPWGLSTRTKKSSGVENQTNVNHGAVRGLWGGLVVGEFNQMKVNQILKVKS